MVRVCDLQVPLQGRFFHLGQVKQLDELLGNQSLCVMIVRRKIERPEDDFPMAPMIDMVFLLLVFFMCLSTLPRIDKSAPIDLPVSEQSRVADNFQGRGILSLDKEGVIHIGQQTAAHEELPVYLKESLARNPDLKIQLRADRQTSYADIKKVLQTGAYEIIYSTYQSH